MNDNYQSGKTQAIDLDELHVDSANRPSELHVRGEFELDKWGDDPWSSTEESRRRRRWADDERWLGDDEEKKEEPDSKWESDEDQMKAGWHAPKRGDVLVSEEGWGDWNNFGGAPKELEQAQESKEFGGYRRVQAASQYAQVDTSDYVDGKAKLDDLYRTKEAFGTSGVRERKGDPYADVMQQGNAVIPEMRPVSEWEDEPKAPPSVPGSEEDMRASAKISNQVQSGDDIPGVTRASIIIFQSDTEPVVFELKKMVTSIGRGLDNMVILNDQYASRRHLTLNYVSGRFELFALSVDNLASVNGYPISHVVLKNNDQIEVGVTRIKFVLGPISDEQMQLRAPSNGRPIHIDPPPQEVRSLKTTRKNLILLISVVGIIVFFVIAGLIIMATSKKTNVPEIKAEAAEETFEITEEDMAAAEAEPEKIVTLERSDNQIIEGMIETYGLGVGRYRMSDVKQMGSRVKILVVTEPEGARIYNGDGSLRGVTPYESYERVSRERKETWTIRKDGFVDKELSVSLSAGVNEKLELLADGAEEPKAEEVQQEEAAPKPKPKPKSKPKPKPKPKPAPSQPNKRIML